MAANSLQDMAAIVQRDMDEAVLSHRPAKGRTLMTFEQSIRRKKGRLAGYQIGYWRDFAHGQTWYNPLAGDFSFKRSTAQKTGAMWVGVAFRNMNITLENHVQLDMASGAIPDSYIKERRRRIATYTMKKNWEAIGNGDGTVAMVGSASGTTLTALLDGSARGSSKGVFRLAISLAADPIYYECINASDAVVAKFFITAKSSATQATMDFTGGSGNAAAMNTSGFRIVEAGSFKKAMTGIGYHHSDSTSRIYQGASVADDPFLINASVDMSAAAVTPTAIHTLKGMVQTAANAPESEFPFVGHLSFQNYRILASYGYTDRQYTLNDNTKSTTTFGLPTVYKDGDTVWVPDADYEEAYIDLRERAPFFEYVQKKFGPETADGISRHEWIGANESGSTLKYENYTEASNIVWDGHGPNGDRDGDGRPNSGAFLKNCGFVVAESQATLGK